MLPWICGRPCALTSGSVWWQVIWEMSWPMPRRIRPTARPTLAFQSTSSAQSQGHFHNERPISAYFQRVPLKWYHFPCHAAIIRYMCSWLHGPLRPTPRGLEARSQLNTTHGFLPVWRKGLRLGGEVQVLAARHQWLTPNCGEGRGQGRATPLQGRDQQQQNTTHGFLPV